MTLEQRPDHVSATAVTTRLESARGSSLLPLLGFSLRRALHTWRLLVVCFLGLVVAVGLVAAVPFYSYGALNRLLWARVESFSPVDVPPGVVLVKSSFYFPTAEDQARYERLDAYVTDHAGDFIKLPRKQLVRSIRSNAMPTWPFEESGAIDRSYPEREETIVYQQDLMAHVRIVDGVGLSDAPAAPGEDVPVIVSAQAADELDVYLDDRIALTDYGDSAPVVPLRVVGFWAPANPADEYWNYVPASTKKALFVGEGDWMQRLAPTVPRFVKDMSWYAVYDQSYLRSTNASQVLAGIDQLDDQLSLIEPTTMIETSLRQSLPIFERQAYLLRTLMLVLSVPTVAVALYYVGVTSGMIVERRRGEISLLRSRGASAAQIVAVYLVEAVAMAALAFGIGLALGVGFAELVGQSFGFMQFVRRPLLPMALERQSLEFAAVVALLAIPALIIPTIAAARHSVVGYRQSLARLDQKALWRRPPVELLLLLAAAYGYYLLRQQAHMLPLGSDETLIVDPLLVITPALFVFGASLLLLRLYPLVVDLLATVAGRLPGRTAPVALALREIARTPAQHASLALLLTLTLALGFYNATTAQTIDQNVADRVRYDVPADLDVWESWPMNSVSTASAGEGSDQAPVGSYTMPSEQGYDVPGVIAAAPYRSYQVTAQVGRATKVGNLLAIDRVKYPAAAWWRRDFAAKPLGALMNALGANPGAALVSRSFLQESGLQIGDPITLTFEKKPVQFYVAEVVDYFPTLYPEKGPFFVANLGYVYDQVGITPYRSWARVEPATRNSTVIDALRAHGIEILYIRDSRLALTESRSDAQAMGLFGALTLGFVVALLLTVLGFFLYTALSFEKRLVQFGVLRAMGLSVGQLLLVLLVEQTALIALGSLFGTGIGLAANYLFIPFLQVGGEAQTPPFVVATAWTDLTRVYLALLCLLLAGLASTGWLVRRMKLHQAVKLGEDSTG